MKLFALSLAFVVSGFGALGSPTPGAGEVDTADIAEQIESRCFFPLISGDPVPRTGLLVTKETDRSFIGNDVERGLVFVVSNKDTHRSCMVHAHLSSDANALLSEFLVLFEKHGSPKSGSLAYECFRDILSQIPEPRNVNATFNLESDDAFVTTLNMGSFFTVTSWSVPSADACFEGAK